MRTIVLALLLGIAALSQDRQLPAMLPAEIVRFREAAAPLEGWLGKKLIIFDDATWAWPVWSPIAMFPKRREPSEATITTGAIYVSLSQLRNFPTTAAFADFLSHAAAHVKLNHLARFREKQLIERILRDSPHVPEKYPDAMRERVRMEFEAEVIPTAVELRATAKCTQQSCDMFGQLLAVASVE